jgi:NADP-reducing hydrogenase subunit HndB
VVKSLDELERIKKEAQAMMEAREGKHTTKIVVGMGTCGIAAGARETLGAIMDELDKRNIQEVAVTQTGCMGMCEQEPIVEVIRSGEPRIIYGRVDAERARRIVVQHVVNNVVVGDLVISSEK